jgi:putative membrane protein
MLVRRNGVRTPLIFRGSVLSDVLPVLSAFVAWSFVPTGLTWALGHPPIDLTPAPFTIVGLALSILLGFRNNACYDRWWEGRKTWGRLVNVSRRFARQVLTLSVAEAADQEALASWRRHNVHRMIAFVYALKHHLRESDATRELAVLLPSEEVKSLLTDANVPDALVNDLGVEIFEAYRRGWIDTMHLPALEASLTELNDIQGICERIKKTPLPLPYSVLSHRIVLLYCATLPFGLVSTVGIWTPLVVSVMAFAFLGLDDVGSQLEDPFERDPNDLPLDALTRRIEVDLRQRLQEPELPELVKPIAGILL